MSAFPIRLQLGLWFALFLAPSVLGIGVFLITALGNDLQREVNEALLIRAAQVEREVTEGGADRLTSAQVNLDLHELGLLEEFASPGIYVEVIDPEGTVLATSANLHGERLPITRDMLTAAGGGRELYDILQVGAERVAVYVRPIRGGNRILGAVVVGESLHLVDVTARTLRQLLFGAAGIAAIVSLGAGWWLTGRALRPISSVTRAARRIQATGRFDERIQEPAANDELRDLAVTFNNMLTSLDRAFTRQGEFLADASHELRGPLMVIRGNLDLLRTDHLPPEERQEAIQETADEVAHVCRLVEDLLFLAESDAREVIERQPVALDEVLAEAFDRAQRLDHDRHEIGIALTTPVIVQGDRRRLLDLTWNLLENALRYTPEGGQIRLSLESQGDQARLTVADTGIGIDDEHLPRIFERFYRVDPARSRQNESTGLGLAIVKRIAEAHGADVHVESVLGQGTTFSVRFPRLEP